VNWILKGDANTNYFHTCANGRRRKTRICSLESEEGVISDQKEICGHIVDFYKKLFENSAYKGMHLFPDFWKQEEKLDVGDREMLGEPFTEKEVWGAIAGMKSDSAPGPNGFTVFFFKKLWGQIKKELMGMVRDFNSNSLDLKRLNYGVITLVPKIKEANTIKQFRPICLLNVDFKVFPKLLIDRLSPVADRVISDSQTVFIKGRNILEGVVILHEVLHEFRRSGKKGVLFKINFEKAYDKVRWAFVQEVMEKKGFPSNWIKQTMATIQGGKVCINVNGERTSFFNTYQGLRQGDPLSPFLFNLVVEVLATLMRKAAC
jgi:hypothetical protein